MSHFAARRPRIRMTTTPPTSTTSFDRIGSVASTLCAIHCALAALLPAALGALGLGALMGHEAEWVFSGIAITCAVGALFVAWRRQGKLTLGGWLLIAGIAGLIASRVLEMGHPHGHHDAHEARAEAHHDDHEAQVDEHHDDHEEHHEHGHEGEGLLGAAVGILAGLALLCGHGICLRENRACNAPDCCE